MVWPYILFLDYHSFLLIEKFEIILILQLLLSFAMATLTYYECYDIFTLTQIIELKPCNHYVYNFYFMTSMVKERRARSFDYSCGSEID